MITPAYAQMMARYNRWQNESLISAASQLSDEERRRDRGAFFCSIAETFAHLLWADRIWLSRFGGCTPPPQTSIKTSTELLDWEDFVDARRGTDAQINNWAASLTSQDLDGDLAWFSGSLGKEISKPRATLIAHMFNHGTHHRGQIHCMLTAAGQKPEDTDLPFMPTKYEETES